ncbi:MAG: hypothetical protein ICV79_22755 [Flavisolibacter sp.]|nr:hypothetical protein [Flavisolibacter sp.]
MKTLTTRFFSFGLILLLSCGSNSNDKSTSKNEKPSTKDETTTETAASESSNAGLQVSSNTRQQSDGIVGEWTLALETYDDNSNHILDADERKKGWANKYYYRFNADGSCLIHSMKLKGHYEIKTENGKKKLYTFFDEGEDKGPENTYEIVSASKDELVLLWETTFWVFKRM